MNRRLFCLLPLEPTAEMIEAGGDAFLHEIEHRLPDIWRAMVGAAPDPWQPIDEAPRDNIEPLLGYWPNGEIHAGQLDEDGWHSCFYNPDEEWALPTHWMRLPNRPNDQAQGMVERLVAPARRAEFKVYAIYDSDIEAPGLFEAWSEKTAAEMVAAIWNKYEETNPFSGDTFPETDDEIQRHGEWIERHPCGRIVYTPPFVVAELVVFGTPPQQHGLRQC